MRPSFDPQPELSSVLLRLRPLEEGDLEALYAAASSPQTWADHPAKERYQQSVFEPYAKTLLATRTALVVIDRRTDRVIGCSRYYVSPDQPESISVGFTFIHHSYWGGNTNFDLKRLMLDHAFQSFPEVWFHIAPTNIRSQRATAKLGAEHIGDAVLDLSGSPTQWMCFRLSREAWQRMCQ